MSSFKARNSQISLWVMILWTICNKLISCFINDSSILHLILNDKMLRRYKLEDITPWDNDDSTLKMFNYFSEFP